jgi:hypothetical protein
VRSRGAEGGRAQFSILLASRARTRARAETKTRRVWRSAAAVSEMEFRNLQVMWAGIAECGRLKPGQCLLAFSRPCVNQVTVRRLRRSG